MLVHQIHLFLCFLHYYSIKVEVLLIIYSNF